MPNAPINIPIRSNAERIRRGRWMLWILRTAVWFVIAVPVILIVVAWLALPRLAAGKAEVEALLSKQIGVPVRMQNLDAKWVGWSPRIAATAVQIYGSDSGPAVITLDHLSAKLDIWPLLSGQIRFHDLVLERPAITITHSVDGRIVVLSDSEPAASPAQTEGFWKWLLNQKSVRILDGRLRWYDRSLPDSNINWRHIDLGLQRSAAGYRLIASTRPESLDGGAFSISLRVSGRLPVANLDIEGRFEIHDLSTALLPPVLQELLPINQVEVQRAELRFAWRDGRLQTLTGPVRLRNLDLDIASRGALRISGLSGTIEATSTASRWRVGSDNVSVRAADRAWDTGRVEFTRAESWSDISIERIEVGDIVPLFSELLDEPARQRLLAANPAGQLEALALSWVDGIHTDRGFSFETRWVNASVEATEKLLGFHNATLALSGHRDGGSVAVAFENSDVAYPRWFPQPIALRDGVGTFRWQRRDAGWSIDATDIALSNATVSAAGSFQLALHDDRERPPHLRLDATFGDGSVEGVAELLPVAIMSDKLVAWLDRALVSGRVNEGQLHIDGPLRGFPYADGRGEFTVNAQIEGGVLDYASGWPRLEDASLTLQVAADTMRFAGRSGNIGGLSIATANAELANLKQKPRALKIDATLVGAASRGLAFLEAGPLHLDGLRKLDIDATGAGRLALELNVPLASVRDTTLTGRYEFDGNEVEIPGAVTLSAVDGALEFTRNRVTAASIAATLYGEPVSLDIRTIRPGPELALGISAQGNARLAALPWITEPLTGHVEGTTSWRGEIEIADGGWRLDVESELVGVSSALPEPLAKPAAAAMPFNVSIAQVQENGAREINITAGARFKAALELTADAGPWRLQRGHAVVGDAPVQLPPRSELLVDVGAEHLDADAWLAVLSTTDTDTDTDTDSAAADSLPVARRIRIDVDSARWLGSDLDALRVDAQSDAVAAWRVDIDGDQARGEITLTPDGRNGSILARLDFLAWPKSTATATSTGSTDPRDLPAVTLTAEQFQYGAMQLGRVELRAHPDADGWVLERIEATRPESKLLGNGGWRYPDSGHRTELEISLDSTDFGATAAALGYAGHVASGNGRIDASLQWRGAPPQFALAHVDGSYSLRVKKGEFLRVDPGTGRLLGLFNIDAVARRLTLDFRDVFGDGFTFDKLEGKGRIERGDLHTDGILLIGPSAIIEVAGRAGLATEDYDLDMTVAPAIAGNLGLVGALASASAGAVLLVAQRLFKKQLAKLIHYKYEISGPWATPAVKRIKRLPDASINGVGADPERDN